jgi:WD40 repeat protein
VVFDRPRGTQQLLRAPGRTFRSLALPGHGRFLLTGSGIPSEPGEALLWDPELGRPIQALPGHRTPVVAVACTPEGDRAATACDDGSVRLWRLEGSRIQGETTLESAPLALAAGPEGGWLVLLSRELVWLDDSARMVQRLALPEPCRHLTVSGPVWCVGGEQGVWLGHRNANEPPTLLDANTREVASLALVDEGRTLAVATGRTVRLWDVASRQERLSLGGHAGGVLWVGFSPHACLSIARNGQLHTWPVAPQNRVGERSH